MRGGGDKADLEELEKLAAEAEANEQAMRLAVSEQGARTFSHLTVGPNQQQPPYQPSPLIVPPAARFKSRRSYALAIIPDLKISKGTMKELINNIGIETDINPYSQMFIENIIKLHGAYHGKKVELVELPPNLVEILGSEQELDALIGDLNDLDE